ncbi:transposase [Pseudonocardia nematodicida]|uniref:Transposase n=1 Tax=Pseudonocardia nematodicida TaxID=1206997 RepID=A0ABV1KKW1_9PSEU
MAMLSELVEVVIGVDTHLDTHTAAVLEVAGGRVRETVTVPADPGGYTQLCELAQRHGGLRAWAIEGSGGYGSALTRHLHGAREEVVIELDRPQRPARRGGRKSDAIDAERAARDALARTQLAQPKTGAERGALQALLTARRSAITAATDAQRQLRALITTAPEAVAARFRGHKGGAALVRIAAGLDPTRTDGAADGAADGDVETRTCLQVLHTVAGRIQSLRNEADTHERVIRAVIAAWRPDLLELPGVGPINAAVVLTAWSHPGRCRDDGAFAMLGGVAPIPASSGRTVRYRLNRHGDRQLNRALHNIAVCRQRYDHTTRAYTERRRAEGKTDREIRRCLKRYIARQLHRQLETPPTRPNTPLTIDSP